MTDIDEPTAPRRARLRTVLIASLAALVIGALITVNVLLFITRSHNDAVDGARTAALSSARERVPSLLSYSYKDVAKYVSSAPQNATGDFKKAFTKLLTTYIAPVAKNDLIATKATVKSIGVIDAHENTVTLLVMINQMTTSKDNKSGRLDGSRARVTMQHVGGTWLVSDMTPV